MLNIQPALTGDLIELRPLRRSDSAELFKAASDPLIWEMHPQPDRYRPEVFKLFFSEALDSHGALAIIDRQTSEIIGTSRYYEYSKDRSSVAIGYTFLARKYWGGLYNRELKRLMVNHALESVATTYFHVGLGNKRSQRAMLKIGGINTGIQEIQVSYAPPKKSYVFKIETPLV